MSILTPRQLIATQATARVLTPEQLAYVGATAPEEPTDPLAALSDNFESGSTDIATRGWTIHKATSISSLTMADGRMRFAIVQGGFNGDAATSFWYNAWEGALVHKSVDGDCDMRARIVVWNSTFDGLPLQTQFRIAGIAVHDPNRSPNLNYTHIGGGVVNGAYAVETKNTLNNSSTFPAAAYSPTSPWDMDVRILRVGTSITTHYRHEPSVALADDTGWTQHQAYTRAFPTTCQWGMMVYANQAVHAIGCDFHEVQFRTPA